MVAGLSEQPSFPELRPVFREAVALTVCLAAVVATTNRFVERLVEKLGDDTGTCSRANGFHFPLQGVGWADLHSLSELGRGHTRRVTGLVDVEPRARVGWDTSHEADESEQQSRNEDIHFR
jgi:hypothetical protein